MISEVLLPLYFPCSISLLKVSGDGRSSLYISASLKQLSENDSDDIEINATGMRQKPSRAVL